MRVPPHDNEAEQAVLGGILIDREALSIVRDVLVPEDFYAERHAVLYRAALALDDRGEAIDTVTLRDQLERGPGIGRAGGMDYIAELTLVVPSSASVKHYADIVIGHALRRRLIEAGGKVSRLGFDNTTPVTEAIDQAEQEVFKIGQESRGSEMRNIAPVVREWWDVLEKRIEHKQLVTGVPTNFSKLDMLTQGLQPGELIILAARPAVGKTSFALNIARNAAVLAGRPVVVFSLEMSRQSLVQRLICSEAHVDSYMLRTGQADSMAFQKIAKAMDTLTHADLWIDDSPGLAINTLRARARRMKSQHKIELIVIDYLQLMQGGRRDSRVQEVSDISSGLKAIAKELERPRAGAVAALPSGRATREQAPAAQRPPRQRLDRAGRGRRALPLSRGDAQPRDRQGQDRAHRRQEPQRAGRRPAPGVHRRADRLSGAVSGG